MLNIICFSVAIVLFLLTIGLAVTESVLNNKRSSRIKPVNIIMVGVFLTGAFLFYPINYNEFSGLENPFARVFNAVIVSVYHVLKLFLLDGESEALASYAQTLDGFLGTAYPIVGFALFIIAPILTFGFILSFFKNVASYFKYFISFTKDVYVFSELNDNSSALATDVAKKHPNSLLIFTGLSLEDDDYSSAMEKLQGLNTTFFKNELSLVNFSFHSKKRKITFFLICNDEEKNVELFTSVKARYKDRKNTELYLFSSSVQSEMLLSAQAEDKIVTRRINPAQSLVYRDLYDHGYELFENAIADETGKKIISAVIVGMGNYGTILTKTLAWFCQMDGYGVKINAFDQNPNAKSIFSSSCPELLDDKYNGKTIVGEPEYNITIHSGYDYKSSEFDSVISSVTDATYVFVSIGSDERNIDCATKLRMLFERIGIHPVIKAVVYNGDLKTALEKATNFKGQAYDIKLVGDTETTYCEDVIIDPDLETDALNRHKKYGSEDAFWKYEYNSKSSMASAIHMRARIKCGIKGADKAENELTEEEASAIEVLEHKRWNAYMRSEGYVFAPKRNDLAKTHHNLVCFDDLSLEDKLKDRRVGSK